MVVKGEIPSADDIQSAALKASEEQRNRKRKKAHAMRWEMGQAGPSPEAEKLGDAR